MMPVMSGDDMVRQIRTHSELDDIPIVVLTAKANDTTCIELLKAGAQDCLVKPFQTHEVLARISGLIARKKEKERSLQESYDRLLQFTNELKGRNEELESIIEITSHDLRSPVVNIMGFSGELSRSAGTLREKIESMDIAACRNEEILRVVESEIPEELDFIQRNTRSIDRMLNSLSRVIHFVLTQINPVTVDTNTLIRKVSEQFQSAISEKKIDFTIDNLPACHADSQLLEDVFSILLDNAITFLDPNRPGKITITGRPEDQRSIYIVEDNGIGIHPGHQQNVFKLFHKLDLSQTGEGIGLTIARRIVERHGGKLWLESDVGKGSKFYISLPNNHLYIPLKTCATPACL